MMPGLDPDLRAALDAELERHDPDRYPVQHATARFHLGSQLLAVGSPAEGARHLRTAVDLFPAEGLPVEHAKATNMLGVALRDLGRQLEAEALFATAYDLFHREGNLVEAAAASHNRGLVLRDLGRIDDAVAAFEVAVATFVEADARAQASAACRELATTQYTAGRLDDAPEVLAQAMDLARRAGDRTALGAAANVLGIVHLAAGDPAAARRAFEDAAGAHPRTVRPAAYAMARSNLALASDRAGMPDHARLAARQALAVPHASPEVVAQATDVLARLGDDDAALLRVLDTADEGDRVGALRAEFGRLAEDPSAVAAHGTAWVAGLEVRPDAAVELAEAWLEVLLEQPPAEFRRVVDAVTAAHRAADGDVARRSIVSAMGRFHAPQWLRLKDTFIASDDDHGGRGGWS